MNTELKSFEEIKQLTDYGMEYWSARDLQKPLGYEKWENFSKVIDKAMLACDVAGFDIKDHFPGARKMVEIGSETKRKVLDYHLSRYACYLIVQNGDPRKEQIALGQTYFAIQTYRQELNDKYNQLAEDKKRLLLRGDIKQMNQLLVEAAKGAGIISNEEYAIFQNRGYQGLYGGLSVADIHYSKELASYAHFTVGKEVREAIMRLGGVMPEDLPTPQKGIVELEREAIKKFKEKNKEIMTDE